ncbi:hypothetical protein MARINON1_51027 [Marinobacter salarius]|nr:hypothetical protein MBHK15_130584 [Marinobacter salarius]VXB67671.1 hypothetical protein MARINON1_51027 [Marinobacter salarius]
MLQSIVRTILARYRQNSTQDKSGTQAKIGQLLAIFRPRAKNCQPFDIPGPFTTMTYRN